MNLDVFYYAIQLQASRKTGKTCSRKLERRIDKLLGKMNTLLEKQSKIMDQQAKAEKYRRIEVLQGIQTNLSLCKGSLITFIKCKMIV